MVLLAAEPRCGQPDCQVVSPGQIDRRELRTRSFPAGNDYYRAVRKQYATEVYTPTGIGNGRFSPLAERDHVYVAELRSAALLESALHEADGPNPRIYLATLENYELHRIRFQEPFKLIDLRDPALVDLGLQRHQLSGATAAHYACTRLVADHVVGSKQTQGMVWTSRQGELHARRNPDGLASEVLRHESLDVAVLYRPDYQGAVELVESVPLTQEGKPTRFVMELANLLRIAIL